MQRHRVAPATRVNSPLSTSTHQPRGYSFLRRPRWVLFTLAILALMAFMVSLSRWQWHRYNDKRDRRDLVARQLDEPPVPIQTVVSPTAGYDAGKALEWTVVTLAGHYRADEQLLVANRSQDGRAGLHVLTPLQSDDGRVVYVIRGFINLERETQPPPAPDDAVAITARIRPTQRRGTFGPKDGASGVLTKVNRVDLERIDEQQKLAMLPVYVELIDQTPAVAATDPAPVPPPDPDLGSHLSYAGQWLIFTACAAAGWVIVVRRTAKGKPGP
jgi:surfeit locus 1 family protein